MVNLPIDFNTGKRFKNTPNCSALDRVACWTGILAMSQFNVPPRTNSSDPILAMKPSMSNHHTRSLPKLSFEHSWLWASTNPNNFGGYQFRSLRIITTPLPPFTRKANDSYERIGALKTERGWISVGSDSYPPALISLPSPHWYLPGGNIFTRAGVIYAHVFVSFRQCWQVCEKNWISHP